MLKTNTKKVMEAMKQEVLAYYPNIEDLKADLKAGSHKSQTMVYNQATRLVEAGCFRVYNQDINDFLRDTLEETQAEADKYFNKSFDLYKHLIAKACEKLFGYINE